MLQVYAPSDGRVISLSDVNDSTFASQLVGPGVGIQPFDGRQAVVAPVDGKLLKVDPHAFIVLVDGSIGVLVHIGINTVRIKDTPFEVLVAAGDVVRAGDPIVRWDPATITDPGMERSVLTVLMDAPPDTTTCDVVGQDVRAGELLFSLGAS